jgi:hypothetical protein
LEAKEHNKGRDIQSAASQNQTIADRNIVGDQKENRRPGEGVGGLGVDLQVGLKGRDCLLFETVACLTVYITIELLQSNFLHPFLCDTLYRDDCQRPLAQQPGSL